MIRHPRSLLIVKARQDIHDAILAAAGKYSLTFSEVIMILSENVLEWSLDKVREERIKP